MIVRRPVRFLSGLVAALAAVMVTVGCTSSSTGSTAGTGQSGPSGTLTVAVDTVLSTDLDPLLNQANAQSTYYPLLFDSLLTVDPVTGKPVPSLATSWTTSPDGKTWTFKLRSGVVFSNGSPLTASDVKFSIERFADDSQAPEASTMKAYLQAVNVINPTTVQIVTKSTAPVLLTDLTAVVGSAGAYIVPEAYIKKVGEAAFDKNPIGSGPFTFVSQDPGRDMEFTANPRYWGTPKPSYQNLSIQIVADAAARLADLQTGEADIITGITGPLTQEVLGNQSLHIKIADDSALTTIEVGNQDNPSSPLSKVPVRKAISKAIDRAAIVKTLLDGQGSPAYVVGFPFGLGFPADAAKDVDTFDPAAAKQMLAQAGYPHGFALTLYADTEGKDFADAIAQNLQSIGITAKEVIVDDDALLSQFQSSTGKKTNRLMVIFGPTGHSARPDFTQLLESEVDPSSPYAQLTTTKYLPLMNAAVTEVNETARANAISQLVTEMFNDEPVIAGWYINSIFATDSRVTSWQPMKGVAFPENLQSVRLG
jgi:peptide/nickel transport system substrate-binding protein